MSDIRPVALDGRWKWGIIGDALAQPEGLQPENQTAKVGVGFLGKGQQALHKGCLVTTNETKQISRTFQDDFQETF